MQIPPAHVCAAMLQPAHVDIRQKQSIHQTDALLPYNARIDLAQEYLHILSMGTTILRKLLLRLLEHLRDAGRTGEELRIGLLRIGMILWVPMNIHKIDL